MYQRGGSIAIAVGCLLTVLFLAWPAHYQTGYVRSRGEVSRAYVTCGVPWSILADRQFGNEVCTPWICEQCVRTARARLVNIAVFAAPLFVLGVTGLVRGRYRRVALTSTLRPLPQQLWWRRRKRLNEEFSHDRPTENRPQVESGGESSESSAPV